MLMAGPLGNSRNSGPSGSTIDLTAEVLKETKGCTAPPGNTNRADPAACGEIISNHFLCDARDQLSLPL
jgi:hypothetical protein